MQNYAELIYQYKLKGFCCSQILLQLGLDEKKTENPDLINAMRGLCGGLGEGHLCGALSGGACLLSLLRPDDALVFMVPALTKWFHENYTTLNCKEIVGDDPIIKAALCPAIIARTYEKVTKLLHETI